MAGIFSFYGLNRIIGVFGVASSCCCRPFSAIASPLNCSGKSFADSPISVDDERDPGRQIFAHEYCGKRELRKCLGNTRAISTSKVRSIVGKLVKSKGYEKALEIISQARNMQLHLILPRSCGTVLHSNCRKHSQCSDLSTWR